jgi:hypothetical protein
MQQLFEKLKKLNIVKRNKLQTKALAKLSFSNALDLVDEISAATVGAENNKTSSPYVHSASLSLGGGRYSCSSIECRRRKLNELARFAALYSDQVYIHNFVNSYSPTFGHAPRKDSPSFRNNIKDDLTLLLEMQPLLESRSINLFSPPSRYCPVCFAEEVFGLDIGKKIKSIRQTLARQILNKVSVEISYEEEDHDSPYRVHESGLEDIFGHSIYRHFEELPPAIRQNRSQVKQLHSGKTILATKEQLKKDHYTDWITGKLLRSCTYHLSVSSVLDTTPVTDHDIDVSILSYITNNRPTERRNRITLEHLKVMVPFAGDVPLSKLMMLRQRESDSFIQFRSALGRSVEEVSRQKARFTMQDAKNLYADIIAPEISKLERKVSEAKRDLVMKPLTSAAGTIAVIAFGAYAGMIPAELSQLATLLGLTKTVYDTVSKTAELADVNKTIRPEEYYYIWKVKHLS